MLAVHFGAGNIGRGFIGNLLYHSGYDICFVDVNKEIVSILNEKREYRVILADQKQDEVVIKNVRAINSTINPEQVIESIIKADLITTAIGPNILPLLANIMREGLRKRLEQTNKPLNIIACENMIGGSSVLKTKIFDGLTEDEKLQYAGTFGFPDSAVDRIVPNQVHDDKLMVKVEPFYEWIVEEPKVVGEIPPVKGITYVQKLNPYIERKLFTVNTGHALAAYFGYYFGMGTINQVMENKQISRMVEGALSESGEFLIQKYNFNKEDHFKYIQKIIQRFSNSYIVDEVTRVGRSPIRKLGPGDRLVSPTIQYFEATGKLPEHLLKGIAVALLYDFEDDEEAMKIQSIINQNGIETAIEQITKLDPTSTLFQGIINQYNDLRRY